jgi:hypothetical protein
LELERRVVKPKLKNKIKMKMIVFLFGKSKMGFIKMDTCLKGGLQVGMFCGLNKLRFLGSCTLSWAYSSSYQGIYVVFSLV